MGPGTQSSESYNSCQFSADELADAAYGDTWDGEPDTTEEDLDSFDWDDQDDQDGGAW